MKVLCKLFRYMKGVHDPLYSSRTHDDIILKEMTSSCALSSLLYPSNERARKKCSANYVLVKLHAYPCVHAHTRTTYIRIPTYIQARSKLLLLSCTCAQLGVQYGL